MKIERIPRPLGITYLAKQYQHTKEKKDKRLLYKAIIQAYIDQQLFLTYTQSTYLTVKANPKPFSTKNKKRKNKDKPVELYTRECRIIDIKDVCIGLGLSLVQFTGKVNEMISKRAEKVFMNKGYTEMTEMSTRASLFGLFFRAQQASTVHESWTTELMAVARLKGYGPLNVKEANSALTTSIGYTKLELELLKAISPQQPKTAIQVNQYGTKNDTDRSEQGMGLTTTMALQILEEKGYTTQELDLNAIRELHGLNEPGRVSIKALPEDAQGAKVFDAKDLEFLEHETRRVHQMGLEPGTVEPHAKKKKRVPPPLPILPI